MIFSGGIAASQDDYSNSESVVSRQVIYLDFDGEETSYNGELLSIDEITVADSELPQERISRIVAKVEEIFAGQNVIFVTERPESGSYSTVFVGKTEAFAELGEITGIAEAVDEGNTDPADNAFVLLDAESSDERIAAVIAHEVGHLLGDSHEGEGIAVYLNNSTLDVTGRTEEGLTLIAEGGVTYPYSQANVFDDGIVSNTTVASGGVLHVSGGGTALDTTIDLGGLVHVSGGGIISGATVNDDIYVLSDGKAENLGIYGTATLRVSEGGLAESVTINDGNVRISGNGTLNSAVISAGYLHGSQNAIVNDVILRGGNMVIYANATATNTVVSGGALIVYGAGMMNGLTLSAGTVTLSGSASNVAQSGARLNIYGEVENLFVSGGETYIYAGATVSGGGVYSREIQVLGTADDILLSGGVIRTSSGGVTNRVIMRQGNYAVSSGGIANDTVISASSLNVYSTAQVNGTVIRGGTLNLYAGAQGARTTVSTGNMTVAATATAEDTTLSGGTMTVNGAANILTISAGAATVNGTAEAVIVSGGTMNVNGTAEDVTVRTAGKILINNGGVVRNITVSGGAASGTVIVNVGGTISGGTALAQDLYVSGVVNDLILAGGIIRTFDGGITNDVIMRTGNYAVSSGGIANKTVVSGGNLNISAGGIATSTTLSGGAMAIRGGRAESTELLSGSIQHISTGGVALSNSLTQASQYLSGGAASETTLYNGGSQFVFSNGEAVSTTISSGGLQRLGGGGKATDTIVSHGGTLSAAANAILGGNIMLGGIMGLDGAVTTVDLSITFVLDEKTAGSRVTIDNLSYLSTVDSYSMSITGTQSGTYLLAGNVASFTDGISLTVDGANVTTLTVAGETVYYRQKKYSLELSAGTLQLSVVALDYVIGDTAATVYLGDNQDYAWDETTVSGSMVSGHSYTKMIYGGTNNSDLTAAIVLGVEENAVLNGYLAGGGNGRSVASTELNFYSGAVASAYVFGGGRNGDVTGNAVFNGSGGAVHNLVGGGIANSVNASASVASTILNLSSGFSTLNSSSVIFGGGMAEASGASATVDTVKIRIDGASISQLYGGGYALAGTATVTAVELTIDSGSFSGYLFGGGRAEGSGAVSTVGSVSMTINGGTFCHVLGGGYAEAGGTSTVTGDVNITVNGGTFNGTIYGGTQLHSSGSGTATVEGNISITVNVADNVVNFRSGSGITVGGNSSCSIGGNTTLTLTGNGSNFQTAGGAFTGWLNAANCGTSASMTHTLRFASFISDNFQARSQGFNHLEFSGNTTLTVTRGISWTEGMSYTFNLSGRSSQSGTAMLTQESGNLGITSDSKFFINLTSGDLTGDSGSFLLMDGMNGATWDFADGSALLTFNTTSAYAKFGGGSFSTGGYEFNLVYNSVNGTFLLEWGIEEGPEGFSLRNNSSGMLA